MKFHKQKRRSIRRQPVFTGPTAEKLRDETARLMVMAGSTTKEAENIATAYSIMMHPQGRKK